MARNLHIDGHSMSEGVFVTCEEGDKDTVAPFMVFDEDQQTNIAGPFGTWGEAHQHRGEILKGAHPVLNVMEFTAALDRLDT